MRGEVPLYYMGKVLGSVEFFEESSMIYFIAQCNWKSDEIARAYVDNLLIGVLEPQENGTFKARKRYSKSAIKENGVCIQDIQSAVIRIKDVISQVEWKKCEKPERIFRDYAMKHALRGHLDILVDDKENPLYVAAPISQHARFALAPAFSQTEVYEIKGENYGVVAVDKKNLPRKINNW